MGNQSRSSQCHGQIELKNKEEYHYMPCKNVTLTEGPENLISFSGFGHTYRNRNHLWIPFNI